MNAIPTNAEIGARIKEERERLGLSVAQVSDALLTRGIKIHRTTINNRESGRSITTAREIAGLADLFEMEIAELMFGGDVA